MDREQIEGIAENLIEAEKNKYPIPPLTSSTENISVDGAYAIQLHQMKKKVEDGAIVKGLKIGLTSKAMQEMFNVHTPDYGFIFDDVVYNSGDIVDMNTLIQPRVEFEIAFFLKSDLVGPYVTAEDVIEATDFVVPAIEVIDSRIEKWQIKLEDTIADNGSTAGAVLGETRTEIEGIDLAAIELKVYKNKELIDQAQSSAVMGNPLDAVAWLANALAPYGITLEKGNFVLSGAISKAVDVEDRDTFTANLGSLGEATVTFKK